MSGRSPTQSDRAYFRQFCLAASRRQLVEIERRERQAGRRVYADIAAEVAKESEQ